LTSPEDLRRDFKRSSRFGIVGVLVAMALTAAIALLFAQNDARPTGALIAIFAIVFGFVFVLLRLQRSDVDRAETRSKLAGLEPGVPVSDPTTVDTNALLGALAIKPVDREAIEAANARTWGWARGSINSGTILMVLIAFAVIPWQLWTAYWSIYVFVPVIVVYVSYLTARAVGAGGRLDQAFDDSDATLEPLGLSLTEHPEVVVRGRLAGPGAQAELEGAIAYEGRRHGRSVSVRIDGSDAVTALGGAFAPFTVETKGERLTAGDEALPGIAGVLEPLRASSYWKGVTVTGGDQGIVVERKRDGGLHWMRDLWLAERLAEAAPSQ
jgi:hypothetical protein